MVYSSTAKRNFSYFCYVVKYFILCFLLVIYIWPLIWIVFDSLKTKQELVVSPLSFPKHFVFENYKAAWNVASLGSATFNSLLVATVAVSVGLFLGALASFALGRMRFRRTSKILLMFFISGMMIPCHCIMVTIFKMYSYLDWTDSRLALALVYVATSLPQTIFILTGFFKGMHNDLFEAACIDGCSLLGLFFRIAFPMLKNGLFVVGIMNFVASWNELLQSLVLISDKKLQTLPIAVTSFVGPYTTNYTQMFAAIVIALLPSIVIYSMFSNRIVEGLTQGAIKG